MKVENNLTVPENVMDVTVPEQSEVSEDSHEKKDETVYVKCENIVATQDASVSKCEIVNTHEESDESFKFENTAMSDVVLAHVDDHKTPENTVQFPDEVDVFKETSQNLDDTFHIPIKDDDEESGCHVLGGEVPLCDQDGFECTPPCSQIPQVDPYARKRKSYR